MSKEVIIRLNSDYIKVKGAEYVQDLVRCWQCKWWNTKGKHYDKCEYHGIVSMNANDFCSYAERREP